MLALKRSPSAAELLGGNVLDVALAALSRSTRLGVDVEADDLVARLPEGDGQRQPDVSEPDDSDLHRGAV